MKNVALGALFIGLAACGGGHNNDGIVVDPDAADTDGTMPGVCNPVKQTGCNTGEKCANVVDQIDPSEVSHIGCVPQGTIALGGTACDPPGGLGADLCKSGPGEPSTCIGTGATSVCEGICDLQAAPAANGCPGTGTLQTVCNRYQGLFVSSGMAVAGACDPPCSPLTQAKVADAKGNADNQPDCGGTNAMGNRGCFTQNDKQFSCAGIPTMARGLGERTNAFGPTVGGDDAFTNGCQEGWGAEIILKSGSMQVICSGYCSPLPMDNTAANAGHGLGDPATMASFVNAPLAAGNATCGTGKKGLGNTEECRFLWFLNINMQGMIDASPFNDTLGICFKPDEYNTYDNDAAAGTPAIAGRKCTTMLPAEAKGGSNAATPPIPATDSLGCVPSTQLTPVAVQNIAKKMNENGFHIRPAFKSNTHLYRHTFE